MSNRPFRCEKCGNYHTPVPVPEGEVCWGCETNAHTPVKSGMVDCHFGHKSATPSERKMVDLLEQVTMVCKAMDRGIEKVENARTDKEVAAIIADNETLFTRAEVAVQGMPEVLRWAGVFELPGMTSEPPAKRYKNIEAMEELVKSNRRPREDLVTLRRSVSVCTEMADEVSKVMAQARVSLGQLRQVATAWLPPVKSSPEERMAKARVAKRARRDSRVVAAV